MASKIGLNHAGLGLRVALALGFIYLTWGSTFLAIRVAVESVPPLLMASARWGVAGLLLYSWSRRQGAPRPPVRFWPPAFLLGALMIAASNGGVTWAETRVPSGLAALLVASVSFWMVLFDWLRAGGTRPRVAVLVGLTLGFLGVALLTAPGRLGGVPIDPLGALVLLLSSVAWSSASIFGAGVARPKEPLLAISMQMLAGSAILMVHGLLLGEGRAFDPARVTFASAASFAYLVVFGSLLGFTLFSWLMRVTSPAVVATYACVNPLVAVFLGWALAGEALTARTLVATLVIVAGVGLVIFARSAPRPVTSADREIVRHPAPEPVAGATRS